MVSFETILDWYNRKWMTNDDVQQFFLLGVITQEQVDLIVGEVMEN